MTHPQMKWTWKQSMRRGVGLHGSAQEHAEAPGLGLGELSHALLLERSCLHGSLGDTQGSGCMGGS